MIVVTILLVVLLHVAVVGGLFAVILGLSGNSILLGLGLITAWAGGFEHLSWVTLLLLLAMAVLAEVVEALLGVETARRFGASRYGMLGTFLGGLVGAAVGTAWLPLIGSLIGAFAGAFAGAFVGEILGGQTMEKGAKAGTGAFLGKVAATTFKFGIGILIAFFTLKASYPLV